MVWVFILGLLVMYEYGNEFKALMVALTKYLEWRTS